MTESWLFWILLLTLSCNTYLCALQIGRMHDPGTPFQVIGRIGGRLLLILLIIIGWPS